MDYFNLAGILMCFTLLSFTPMKINAKQELMEILRQHKLTEQTNKETSEELHACTCGIFMTHQIKNKDDPPIGDPVLQHSYNTPIMPKGSLGVKLCTNKCIEMITKHLANSKEILCAVVGKDIEGEKAYLFVKNCEDKWVNTNLSSGQSYCCKNGIPYPCPITPMSVLAKRSAK